MNMASKLQEYLDEVYCDNYDGDKLDKTKAYGAALLSGAIDGAVIMYIPLLIGCIAATKELKKLKGE